jgi:hypothetical protein
MLSRELMGALCLGVLWVTAILVAGAAWQDFRDLRAIVKRAARKMIDGVVKDGDFAEWSVEQTGRATDDDAIAFHDRTFHSEIFGGKVGNENVAANPKGEVWIDEKAREEAASCGDVTTYDAAYAIARKAKGFARTVRVRIRAGQHIWVIGNGEIVATFDPSAWASRKSLVILAFIPIELALCAAATRLALSLPRFGTMSIIGAVACIAFFLGVTPVAVALRESVRFPHEAFLRTVWSRKALATSAVAAVASRHDA